MIEMVDRDIREKGRMHDRGPPLGKRPGYVEAGGRRRIDPECDRR